MSNATQRSVTPVSGRAAHSTTRPLAPHRLEHLAIDAIDVQTEDVEFGFVIDLGTLGPGKLP